MKEIYVYHHLFNERPKEAGSVPFMTIKMRAFHWNEDFELVQNFLIETFNLTKTLLNWIPSRFENRKFGPCGETEYQDEEDELVKIWEEIDESDPTSKPKIVAVNILESSPICWINIHPDYRYLEAEIISDLEDTKRKMGKIDEHDVRIAFMVPASNTVRIELLKELGYSDLGPQEHNRIRSIDLPIPDYDLPEGFSIKHVDIADEFEKYRMVVGSVFTHCGNMTEKLAKIYSEASFYHDGMDLVVVAPDGNFAAFTTIRMDPVSKITEFEPVGTHPDYRRLGLAKSIILEGLKRLETHKPTFVCIPGAANNESATRLYDSLGFSKEDVHAWRKYL